jgi:hypothetical protein
VVNILIATSPPAVYIWGILNGNCIETGSSRLIQVRQVPGLPTVPVDPGSSSVLGRRNLNSHRSPTGDVGEAKVTACAFRCGFRLEGGESSPEAHMKVNGPLPSH